MTPITKRQKRVARRGRPRLLNVDRTPSGQLSRAQEPKEAADVIALDARARHLGITPEQAKDQRAGSFLGYLYMLGRIDGLSERQYEAAMRFQELRRQWLRAHQIPDASLDNGVRGSAGEMVSDSYVRWVHATKAKFADARKAIMDSQGEHRGQNLWAAVDLVIIQEQPMHHLIGATRIVCNALARHFGT